MDGNDQKHIVALVCLLVGWLVGWWVGCLLACLVGWLVGWIDVVVCLFVCLLVGWMVRWLVGWSVCLFVCVFSCSQCGVLTGEHQGCNGCGYALQGMGAFCFVVTTTLAHLAQELPQGFGWGDFENPPTQGVEQERM